MMSYISRNTIYGLVANSWLYSAVYAGPFSSCPRPCQVQFCETSDSSCVVTEPDGQEPLHTSQHLSNEAIIGIIALLAAVLVVPFISKYLGYWIARHYRRSSAGQANSTSGISSAAQDQYAVQGTLPQLHTNIEANLPANTDRPPLVPIFAPPGAVYELEGSSVFPEAATR
ncbi:hypothetical protein O1611_g3356 [Lasiodiplodia mahajangana]|uniref:Uncharacterized protein n=1 Tax=Lasiodiplodia mahajangana TaxID=1108764 RepID=A0ACC2JSN3_9PEZI|nr:hypothetical protein O1611_g3356 [Lasiodiplodia mahajangana]